MKRTCIQCGKEFELTQNEIHFYKKKKLSLPKRCGECREKNKGRKNQTDPSGKKTAAVQSAAAEKKKNSTVSTGAGSKPAMAASPYGKEQQKHKRRTLPGVIAALLLLLLGAVTGGTRLFAPDLSSSQQTAVSQAQAPVFRNEKLLQEHYEKHGIDMGFDSASSYEEAAGLVVMNEEALHKTEKEDGDDVYYLEETNEFVVVSTDGYIRTYYCPEDGKDYFERQ